MSVSTAPGVPSAPSEMGATTGLGYLLRFMLRRDAVRLVVWSSSILAFCVYYVVAIDAVYPTAEDRQNRAVSMSNPGGILLGGPGYGLDNYTVGAMFVNEMSLWLMVFLTTMNILQIIRNTCVEEESGRAELVRALPVGRYTASVAAFLVVGIADAVVALVGSVLLISVGHLAIPDTVTMMAGLMLTALVFGGVATLTCQLTVHSGGASGMAFAALGAAALIRGIGDIQQPHGSSLSWLSPIAWTQQTRAYVDLRLWPLGVSVVAIVVVLALGALLATRRELGGALLPERPGPAEATANLANPFALALRQQRTALLCWLGGCAVTFGLAGMFLGGDGTDALESIAEQNSLTKLIFGDDPLGAFLAIMMLHNALVVMVFAIAGVLRVKPEEDEGRLALSLSHSASRTRVLLSHIAVVALGAFLLLFVGGELSLWTGAHLSGADVGLDTLLTSGGAFALGIAVTITFTAALFAWIPRATPLAWVLFGVVVVESFFGAFLNLPDPIKGLSPFWWVGDYPSTPIQPTHLAGLAVVAVALLALAVLGFRRRDLTAG